ncbi:uncharacterized protein LOC122266792 [Penaeus japonicus]|uniref:uncharacterized protein LOC122266792 n=1 Tax=Penaeus japonicus TaxID=27405 RepID=UPI001C70F948|nr:uncharacterized protein LOC122266792 [Penaeus japonicus]
MKKLEAIDSFVSRKQEDNRLQDPLWPVSIQSTPLWINQFLVLGDIAGVKIFMDDVLIHTSTLAEHHKLMDIVFRKLFQHRMTLKPSKCKVAFTRTHFLDHTIGDERLQQQFGVGYSTGEILHRTHGSQVAVLDGIHKFYYYLYSIRFTPETVHLPLSQIIGSKTTNARLMRWPLCLQQCEITIRHI